MIFTVINILVLFGGLCSMVLMFTIGDRIPNWLLISSMLAASPFTERFRPGADTMTTSSKPWVRSVTVSPCSVIVKSKNPVSITLR